MIGIKMPKPNIMPAKRAGGGAPADCWDDGANAPATAAKAKKRKKNQTHTGVKRSEHFPSLQWSDAFNSSFHFSSRNYSLRRPQPFNYSPVFVGSRNSHSFNAIGTLPFFPRKTWKTWGLHLSLC